MLLCYHIIFERKNYMEYIKINKHISTPFYSQIKDCIIKAIEDGTIKANDKLPTEQELCETLKISRPVVRQAYAELLSEGVIVRYKGKGTFVREREVRENFFKELSSFYQEMKREGLRPSTKVLELKKVGYDEAPLELNEDEECLHIKRLRYGNDIPIVLVDTYIPLKYFDGLENYDFENLSLYDIFEKDYDTTVFKANRFVCARIINNEDAKLLQVKRNTAIHYVKTIAFDQMDRAIELSIARYPGERNTFEVQIDKR